MGGRLIKGYWTGIGVLIGALLIRHVLLPAWERKRLLRIDGRIKKVEIDRDGHTKGLDFTVENSSKEVIRVIGAEVPCSCVRVGGIPTELKPGHATDIGVEIVYRENFRNPQDFAMRLLTLPDGGKDGDFCVRVVRRM